MIFVFERDEDIQKALHSLAFVGLDQRVKGYLAGGMRSWLDAGMQHNTLPQITVYQLQGQLHNGLNIQVLDVRETSEWGAGRIEEALYIYYKFLCDRIEELKVKPEEHVSVLCARGLRSSTAYSILLMNGFEHV